MGSRLRVLVATNLYPSNVDPGFAPFNRQQFAELGKIADVEILGLVPWRLGSLPGRVNGQSLAHRETIDGLAVTHPQFLAIPGLPSLNATSIGLALARYLAPRRGRVDVLLACYAYPDGVAGVALGKALGLPVVVKCHGSDLNRVPGDFAARFQLRTWLPRASRVVCVSQRLSDEAERLGVDRDRLRVVYNGVDRRKFAPRERAEVRRKLGLPLDAELVVYVGTLAEHMGTRELLHAIPRLQAARPGVITAFVGDGPLASEVTQAAEHGSPAAGRVIAVGRVRHDEVPEWMAAADLLCLPSWDEGMPNVVREAHAIGRAVVATRVGGLPEIVQDPLLGRLVPPRDPQALASAIAAELEAARGRSADAIRARAIVPTWEESAAALCAVLEEAARSR
jgi:glycosyltransferase involved in cell wall biosynthesis